MLFKINILFYDVLKVLKFNGGLKALRLLLKTDNYEFLRYLAISNT